MIKKDIILNKEECKIDTLIVINIKKKKKKFEEIYQQAQLNKFIFEHDVN